MSSALVELGGVSAAVWRIELDAVVLKIHAFVLKIDARLIFM